MAAAIEPKNLNVNQVRHPGQWMPVGSVAGGEGQPMASMLRPFWTGVLGQVLGVVVIVELKFWTGNREER